MKKLIFILFLALVCNIGLAQQNKLDSVLHFLEQSRIKNGLDTAKFFMAIDKIFELKKTDSTVIILEKAASKFDKGDNQDLSFFIKHLIFISLSKPNLDMNKAIIYGKENYEKLEKYHSQNADILRLRYLLTLKNDFIITRKYEGGLNFFNQKRNDFKVKNNIDGLSNIHFILGGFYAFLGSENQAVYHYKKSISYVNDSPSNLKHFWGEFNRGSVIGILNTTNVLSHQYILMEDYKNALFYANLVIKKLKNTKVPLELKTPLLHRRCAAYSRKTQAKLLSNQIDSLEYYFNTSEKYCQECNYSNYLVINKELRGIYYKNLGKLDEAEKLFNQCEQLRISYKITAQTGSGIVTPNFDIAEIKIQQKKYNEAIKFLNKNLELVTTDQSFPHILKTYRLLAQVYELSKNHQKASFAYQNFATLQDSLLTNEKKHNTLSFELEQQVNEKEQSILELQSQGKINSLTRNYSVGIAVLLLLLVGGVYARYKTKQKANQVLEKTLVELKSTQNQLIQKEKLASLGELTAGIAHEIQNPLNFVNNFSELSVELIREIQDERQKTSEERDEALENELLSDLSQNQEKINHHGKRASSIVKGMLEHSRASTGVKELTDINALADEYLRLSYHGLRAKDNTFNADFKTDFDENLPKIAVIPQDFGRVLLNLFNNAFYAVSQRKNLQGLRPVVEQLTGFVQVIVSTKKLDNFIEIRVTDNGIGMSEATKAKIFQPFFTTKPTGQGTGLGLSLAYDIITKGHGGTIDIESKEGEGSEFIIKLPIQNNQP